MFYALRQISIKFGIGVCTKIYRVTVSFMKLGALKSQTLLMGINKFLSVLSVFTISFE
jgi:hypothetical protein